MSKILQAPIAPSSLSVQYRATGELKPHASNPRVHTARHIEQIAASIQAFGFSCPILIDRHLNVISGHGRLAAATLLGLRRVPTISLEHLSEEQAAALRIADNRLTETSTWDPALLRQQFETLSEVDLSFDLSATGFELPEIDLILQGDPTPSDAPDPADEPVEARPVVSRLGDIWQLGPHRIVCGSALDPSAYAEVMRGDKANLVFTDPPYNVPVAGHVSGLGKVVHREFLQASGEMSRAEFTEFLTAAFRLAARYSDDGALHYVAGDWRHAQEYLAAAEAVYTEVKNCCVWDKGTGGMGSHYRSQHEFIWIFKAGKGKHTNNVQLGRFGRSRTNVWQYPGINSFARTSEEGNLLELHPTVKPVALVADAIMDASNRGEIVLDPFLGSGTTIVAAERTGRIARGIELDPAYVDVAIRRWQRLSRRSAIHAALQCTFGELEETRGPSSHG